MSKRRRLPEDPLHHPGKPPTLKEIEFATCDSLKFPYDLSCDYCKPKRSVVSNTRKPRKTFKTTTNRNRCEQFWDERWTSFGKNSSSAKIKKHIATRKYLRIDFEITLEEICCESTPRRGKTPPPPPV